MADFFRPGPNARTCQTCGGSKRVHIVAGTCQLAHDRDCPTCVGWPIPFSALLPSGDTAVGLALKGTIPA